MCFSAEASFTATAVLGLIGLLTIRSTRNPSKMLLASTPLIFALQQFSEGLLWTSFTHLDWWHLAHYWKYLFLTVALVIWPLWIPLSIVTAETEFKWKRLQYIFLAIGALYSGFMILNLCYRWPSDALSVQIVGNSIYYQLPIENGYIYTFFYVLATLVPFFLSTIPYLWVVGLVDLFGLISAYLFFEYAFISVWCFFAAVISLTLYAVLKNNQKSREHIGH